MATGRPMRFKWQHGGSVTHSTLKYAHYYIKLCVVNWQFWVNNGFFSREMANNGRIMAR